MSVKRKTKSVNIILSIFDKTKDALSVVDLVERLKDNMNKTTVYRILDRLEGEGIIHSFLGINGLKWYARCHDCSTKHHHDIHPHFQCKSCGKTECLSIEIPVPSLANYQIESTELLLTGLCADCAS